jgi:hypothetical protein
MKKLMIISGGLWLLTISSCVKKYSCKCSTNLGSQGYYPIVKESTVPIDKRVTKKKAQKICDNTAVQLRENTRELIHGFDISTKCEIKDY